MRDPIAKRLFENAIDSVELGLEDFGLANRGLRRCVSSTRNVFAGMLLLSKSWLAEESADENYVLLRTKREVEKKEASGISVGRFRPLLRRKALKTFRATRSMFTTLHAGIRRSQTHTYARSLKKVKEINDD